MKNAPSHLTRRQELFCVLYAGNSEYFGNATKAYMQAYGCSYDAAKSSAHDFLTNPYILKRIDDLLDKFLEEVNADREMAYVLAQRRDLRAKVMAYVATNKVRGRIDVLRGKGVEFTFSWVGDD